MWNRITAHRMEYWNVRLPTTSTNNKTREQMPSIVFVCRQTNKRAEKTRPRPANTHTTFPAKLNVGMMSVLAQNAIIIFHKEFFSNSLLLLPFALCSLQTHKWFGVRSLTIVRSIDSHLPCFCICLVAAHAPYYYHPKTGRNKLH